MVARALCFLALLSACPRLLVEREGRRCTADNECARGYDCHPATMMCTPELQRNCGGEGVCWSEAATGKPCSPAGAFLPCCPELLDCAEGYRTCLAGAWTDCIVGDCTPSDEICDNKDNNCNGAIDTEATDCAVFYADTDGDGLGNFDDHRCLCVGASPHVVRSAGDCDDSSDCCGDDCSDDDENDIADCRDDIDLDDICNADDDDDDGDGVVDLDDPAPIDARICRDADSDGCDDCALTGGPPDPANDGVDTDGDGACNLTDPDDDGDTVADAADTNPLLATVCVDTDDDGCDDCALTGGPPDPANDGTDGDSDGFCVVSDCLDDDWTVNPDGSEGPLGDATCTDGLDNDCDGEPDLRDVPDCWWHGDWYRRVKILFDNTASTADLVWFPVALRLSTSLTDFSYDDTMDAGEDLRFFNPGGGTELAYEIERWNESGTSVVWVRVPRIDVGSDTDFIWMYFGNDSAVSGQQPDTVWSNNYAGVWHLSEDPGAAAPQFVDSSNNGNDLSSQGNLSTPGRVGGRIGVGVGLSGADGQALRGGGASLNFAGGVVYTVSAWIYPRGGGVLWHGVVSKGNVQQYALSFNSVSRYLHYETVQGGVGPLNSAVDSISLNAWHHVAIRFNGSAKVIFIDGAVATALAADTLNSTSNTEGLRVGEGNDLELFRGVIDEVHLSTINRPLNYLRAEYLNGMGSFVSYDAIEMR